MRAGGGIRALEKIKRSGRAHGGNFRERIARQYPMCQLLFWLAFERVRKALEYLEVTRTKEQKGQVKGRTLW